MVNPVPTCYGDDGRATPPPLAGFPPKYTQAHFEDVKYFIVLLLTLLHSERPKLYTILAFLSAVGLKNNFSLAIRNYGPCISKHH